MVEQESSFNAGRYAAIDIGTVTCRLLVADVDDHGGVVEVRRRHAITNLGVGVDAKGFLAADAIERVGAVVDGYAGEIAALTSREEVKTCAIATSAARDSSNADELAARLSRAGIELSVISGEREAALSFSGATSAFGGRRAVVVDVGGGSTEIIAGRPGGRVERARSFQVGCRRVTERFFTSDPPDVASLEEARRWVGGEFAGYLASLSEGGYFDGPVIAVAGTATSAISIREQMEVYDSSRVHGSSLAHADVHRLERMLADMTLEERRLVVGLDPARAPVIVAGMLILGQILEVSSVESFTVSENDILHGIILDAARS